MVIKILTVIGTIIFMLVVAKLLDFFIGDPDEWDEDFENWLNEVDIDELDDRIW